MFNNAGWNLVHSFFGEIIPSGNSRKKERQWLSADNVQYHVNNVTNDEVFITL